MRAVSIPDYGLLDSLGAMAEKVLREAPPRFALAGHSMGGRVALEILRRAPERVAALALLDTGVAPLAAGEAGERETAGRHELLVLAREQGMAAMAARWVQGMLWAPRLNDTALVQGVIDMFARRTRRHVCRADSRAAGAARCRRFAGRDPLPDVGVVR